VSFVIITRSAAVAALCLTTAVFTTGTAAQERDISADNLKGFDGVVTQCVTFVKYKFANNMCKRYMDWIASYADANKVAHAHLGQTQWGYGTDEYLTPPADSGISNPVYLTLYIRATRKPDSVFLWTSLYTPQDASAVRADARAGLSCGKIPASARAGARPSLKAWLTDWRRRPKRSSRRSARQTAEPACAPCKHSAITAARAPRRATPVARSAGLAAAACPAASDSACHPATYVRRQVIGRGDVMPGFKAEAAIIGRVAQHQHGCHPARAQPLEPRLHQRRADATALPVRCGTQRPEQRRKRSSCPSTRHRVNAT
jgi:hypothetical protein